MIRDEGRGTVHDLVMRDFEAISLIVKDLYVVSFGLRGNIDAAISPVYFC